MIMKNVSVFYIPQVSPFPTLLSGSIFNMLCVLLMWAEGSVTGGLMVSFFAVSLMITFLWFLDVYWEMGSSGFSSFEMDSSLKTSMMWFISSEVMFFFSFFFSYIAMDSCTEIASGTTWPPIHIPLITASSVPLLNTLILLSSGISLTWCHHMIITGCWKEAVMALMITLLLAVSFTFLQLFEYEECGFSMNDSFFGSIFFMATGFHGLHVILGSIMLLVCLNHVLKYNVCSNSNHAFFEMSSWYWHFVDVVWLFLFLIMYCNAV